MERRWDLEGVPVVFDGAHVASSLELVLAELSASENPPGAPQVVLSLARDKDHVSILKALRRHVDSLYCTTVQSGIHLDAARLTEMAKEEGFEAKEFRSSRDALHRASARAAAGGWVLVTGSLYLVGDLRGLTTATNPSSTEPPC
jgi:dihydrofolate synthase/folylpolyglutamate synthase